MATEFEPGSDLPWKAYCYVCRELSAEEEAAFEARLAEDQAAREAVAEAVELAGAVRLVAADALPGPVPRRARWPYALGGLVTGIAACLALWLVPSRFSQLREPTTPPLAPAPAPSPDIVLAWSDLIHETDLDWGTFVDLNEPDISVPEEPLPLAGTEAEAEPVPAWLFEVVDLSDLDLDLELEPQPDTLPGACVVPEEGDTNQP
jgi:hypothetical protein